MVFFENLETCTNVIMEETVFKMNITHYLRKTLFMQYKNKDDFLNEK